VPAEGREVNDASSNGSRPALTFSALHSTIMSGSSYGVLRGRDHRVVHGIRPPAFRC